ncbi:MAG: rRNA maturation RNase YbeY [Alphaproteobacteria bacterium]|nr:rRNA maturation RNase YbeY [Alphaproteobacteria bacterium]MBM3651605.1 rRNA maturation RNase YbeY [Alphaproteobacteria bacterium]
MDIDVNVAARAWRRVADLEDLAKECVRQSLAASGAALASNCEVSVTFCDDEAIRELNAEWRGKDQPTNVLSFPTPGAIERKPLLGDVIIAYETVAREAEEQGKLLRAHASHMVAHGFLHLIGYDHETAAEAERMEALERKIAMALGFSDPYAEDAIGPAGGAN